MIKIAIVEDEKNSADKLIENIQLYSRENNIKINTEYFLSAELFLQLYAFNFDIVFMDIEMPGINGMDAVKKLREINTEVLVIFVTNLARYAVKGYEVNAFDFIVKPVDYSSFAIKFSRAINKIEISQDFDIWISTRRGKKMIKTNDIFYIEVMKHTIIYHTKEGDYAVSGTLKKEQDKLSKDLFALCNQCYLVNLKYVTEIIDYWVVVGKDKLQISTSKRKSFIRVLNNYLGGMIQKENFF